MDQHQLGAESVILNLEAETSEKTFTPRREKKRGDH
jgi:hypothetical protein